MRIDPGPRFLLVCSLSLLLATLPGEALAGRGGRRDPEKVRLLSVADAPDPVTVPGQVSKLTATVAVRKVAGLVANDRDDDDDDSDDDRRNHRQHHKSFWVQLFWTIKRPGAGSIELTREVEVRPPHNVVRLASNDGRSKKKFVTVPVVLDWDGRDRHGNIVSAATYSYEVQAEFVRVHEHRGRVREKIIDETDPVPGSVTVKGARPAPPGVNSVPATTNVAVLTLSGTKPADTALFVNGVEHLALSQSTTWSTTKTLFEGPNEIRISVRDVRGVESDVVTLTVILDTIPPTPPLVDNPPADVTTPRITFTGTKPPGTSVLINGVVVVHRNDTTMWSAEVMLEPGDNSIVVETEDAAGNRSITQGGQVMGVASSKPVIGDLSVTPPIVSASHSVTISYKLFAVIPPAENANLDVSVNVEDGDRSVRALFAGIQHGAPSGAPYSVLWDGTDDAGQPVPVNTSYRIVVTAERVSPTTQPRELVDANPKQTAVVVMGSQQVTSPNGKLKIIFRPDDAKLRIDTKHILTARQATALSRRQIRPVGTPYHISIDRPFASPVVGILRHPVPGGRLLKPYFWDEKQQDWMPGSRANWSPATMMLSFAVPGPGLMVVGSTPDFQAPAIVKIEKFSDATTFFVRDLGSGIRADKFKCLTGNRPPVGQVQLDQRRGSREASVRVPTTGSGQHTTVYLEDWAGNGRLYRIGRRTP